MVTILNKLKKGLRGDVRVHDLALEVLRRIRAKWDRRIERQTIDRLNEAPAILSTHFRSMPKPELLSHFSLRRSPVFFPGFEEIRKATDTSNSDLFPDFAEITAEASRIASTHCWPLLGYPSMEHGDPFNWLRDPLSGKQWQPEYHADISLKWEAGSDIRVLWELNRFGHTLKLAEGFAVTGDEGLAEAFFAQVESWQHMNPVGKGPNWICAMEVAIRAINFLVAFEVFRHSQSLTEARLEMMLRLFDGHGRHIKRNLEFSHLVTSNHYLSDVVGLLWLGVMLPELDAAADWREFGLSEMLTELQKQVLPDGVDFESSTGYHRLALELFLYSFCLCRLNEIEIDSKHWARLGRMVEYLRAYLRPDGRAPLIGDNDSGRILPLITHTGDDHSYLLDIAAVAFNDSRYKLETREPTMEVAWLFGSAGVELYKKLAVTSSQSSQAFNDGGIYVLRNEDLYLLLNASDSGIKGRGSHGHNDALGIEVSAFATAFIVDPGTYVYTSDLEMRHIFRSTAYHSTVEIDGKEQNTINRDTPFLIGNQARPRLVSWKLEGDVEIVEAEHFGYSILTQPVIHRRAVRFDKLDRFWLIEDSFSGSGTHDFMFRFLFAPDLNISVTDEGIVEAASAKTGAYLLIAPASSMDAPKFEALYSSQDYGAKQKSTAACWMIRAAVPLSVQWILVPERTAEARSNAIKLISRVSSKKLAADQPTIKAN
ncbi:MAG: hypothetical protein QOH96_2465 [Blastocatellia bacterium]|nr:hypothetical protein [Blastocatellia bacterium]